VKKNWQFLHQMATILGPDLQFFLIQEGNMLTLISKFDWQSNRYNLISKCP